MEAWPLTGRAEELGVIATLFDRDAGTTDAGVVIAGRPGVGKTRLAREAAAEAAKLGWAVRWAGGTAAARSIPLGVFAQWADRLDGSPLQIVGALIAAVTDDPQGRPLLVAVDDVHLLDDLSAFVLQQLVVRRAAVVIATLRSGESAPETVTALWKDGHLHRLDLQPLSEAHTVALLERVLGGSVASACADRMWSLTRGNVLFLRQMVTQELLADRISPGPEGWEWAGPLAVSDSLTDLVRDQIGDVPDTVGEVVDLVAVAEPLELELLGRLAEPEAIQHAERGGLITVARTPRGDVVQVGHPLFAEVRVARAGRIRLAGQRGRVAQAMTAPGQDRPVDPVRLALLWLQSDLPPDHGVLFKGAQDAIQRLDIALARRLAEAAVRAGAGVDAELLWANTLSLSSRGPEAEELLQSVTARRLPEPAWSTAVILRALNLLWPLGRPEQSRRVIDDALSGSSRSVSHRLSAFRAVQLAVEARPAEALQTYESIDRSELSAVPALISSWAHTIAVGDLGDPLAAGTIADEAPVVAASPEAGFYHAVIRIVYYSQALVLGGFLSQALTVARSTDRQCADVPGGAQGFSAGISGVAALGGGDLKTAIERLRRAVTEFADRTDGGSYCYGIDYTMALARSGDLDAAADALAQMRRDRHPAHTYRESDSLLAAAWVSAAHGRTSQARALAHEAAEFARTHGQRAREVMCLQTAIQFGELHNAARLAELAETVDGPRVALVARWATAVADPHGGAALLSVSHDLEAMGDRIAAADAAAHASIAFRRAHRNGAALTASAHAARLAAECGAVTPATRAAATPVPLSDREREIATLVAAGLTNKQIADRLTLSVRTVEGHIYRCSTRLGLTDRSELAHLMSEITHTRVQD